MAAPYASTVPSACSTVRLCALSIVWYCLHSHGAATGSRSAPGGPACRGSSGVGPWRWDGSAPAAKLNSVQPMPGRAGGGSAVSSRCSALGVRHLGLVRRALGTDVADASCARGLRNALRRLLHLACFGGAWQQRAWSGARSTEQRSRPAPMQTDAAERRRAERQLADQPAPCLGAPCSPPPALLRRSACTPEERLLASLPAHRRLPPPLARVWQPPALGPPERRC